MKLEESVAHLRYIDLKPGMVVKIADHSWSVKKKYKDDFRIFIKSNGDLTIRLSGGEANTHRNVNPRNVWVWNVWEDQIRMDKHLGLPNVDDEIFGVKS